MRDVICKEIKGKTFIGEMNDKGPHGLGFVINKDHHFAMGTFTDSDFTGFGVCNNYKDKLIFGNFKKGIPEGICCYQCEDHIYFGYATVYKDQLMKCKVGIELYPNGDWVIAGYHNGEKNMNGFYYKASEKMLLTILGFNNAIVNASAVQKIEKLECTLTFPNNNIRYLPAGDYQYYQPNQFEYSDEDYYEEIIPTGKKEGMGVIHKEHEFTIAHYNNDSDYEGEGDGIFYTNEQIDNGDTRITLGLHRFECFSTYDDVIEDQFNEDLCLQYYQSEDKYVLWNPVTEGPVFTFYRDRIEIVFDKGKVLTFKNHTGLPTFSFPEPAQQILNANFKDAFKAESFTYDKKKGIYMISSNKAKKNEAIKEDSEKGKPHDALDDFLKFNTEEENKEAKKRLDTLIKEAEKDHVRPVQAKETTELDKYIGLENIKQQIPIIKSFASRKNKEFLPNLNFVFAGNPGTGKTVVARTLGKILYDCGALSDGTLYEKSAKSFSEPSDVVDAFEEARGGVLFIDEAYSMITFTEDISEAVNDRSGAAIVQALIKCLEDYRGELCVILAGYKDKLDELLKFNDGFASRINRYIDFPNYTNKELREIAKTFFKKYKYVISEENLNKFMNSVYRVSYKKNFGNAREVRNNVEKLIEYQNYRTYGTNDNEIKLCDIEELMKNRTQKDEEAAKAENEVKKLVGLKSVKLELNKIKCFLDPKYTDPQTMAKANLNMVFIGNPGTGKTTIARQVADILCKANVLPTNRVVETDRSNFISQWRGMTPQRTRNTFESALGGVLFIDEAYSLCQGPDDQWGHQAVDMLLKLMLDYKGRICVIFAGYSREMYNFIHSNPGLPRRIGRTISFPDFTPKEIEKILMMNLEDDGREMKKDARDLVLKIIEYKRHFPNFGNAGEVENILQGVYEINAFNNNGNRTVISLNDVKQYMQDRNIELVEMKKAKWHSSLAKIKKISETKHKEKFKFTSKYLETRVVSVTACGFGESYSQGSGFFIDDRGTIVTNAHVVEGATKIYVTAAIKINKGDPLHITFDTEVIQVGSSRDKDVAILQICNPESIKFDYLPLASAKFVPAPLSEIAMAGYPLGEARFNNVSYNLGKVQSINKDPVLQNNIDYLLVDMTGQHGSSGSGVIDTNTGCALGLFTRIASQSDKGVTQMAMVVPVKYVWEILEKIKR